MGDKAAARRLAASLDVPILAGYDDPDQSDEALLAAATRVGFPMLVKPAAGGGGKGMRTVREPHRLAEAIGAARREAAAAFGDDRLILERLVVGARHVEIQVLFDGYGAGVSLGERDCSIQRRHQKVLEEAPSPAVTPAMRERLGAAALRLAAAVGYVGAGTCEFLLDERGEPVFLEMNTRLQVEHPVTELVTGRDLVADQLRIAAGERLGLDRVGRPRHRARRRGPALCRGCRGRLPPGDRAGRGTRLARRRGHPRRRRDRARQRDRRPVRPDAGQDHRLGAGPGRGARAARGRPRPDRRPRAS